MNTDIAEGKWKQMKGAIQKKWGDITDDDFDRIKGNRERFIGVLQERYGRSKEEAKKEIDTYLDTTH
ncbi:CsbD family protein [Cellvibrio sp. NN19]|uniref:CsbD family protein n=1 Tax=Cellvibrio chitinivorans TaxID=3102792 RepID=UPI002B405BE0|nr:CsbD family protein [Cellvibrio sp. NN19]